MNGVNQDPFFPLLRTFLSVFIIIEQIGSHKCLGLNPAVIAGDNPLGFVVLITFYSSKDGLLDNGDFIFIRTGDTGGIGVRLRYFDAERSVCDFSVIGKGAHIELPEV